MRLMIILMSLGYLSKICVEFLDNDMLVGFGHLRLVEIHLSSQRTDKYFIFKKPIDFKKG